jgi:hypothetical protein
MPAPNGAVGYKIVRPDGQWFDPKSGAFTATEPSAIPLVQYPGSASDTVEINLDPSINLPSAPYRGFFYDKAGARVGGVMKLDPAPPGQKLSVIIQQVIAQGTMGG